MDNSLNDILNGDEPEATTAEVEAPEAPAEPEKAEPEAKAEPARDEKGRFTPKGETEDAPPASEEKPEKPVFEGKATLAERQKRQELERRLQDAEQRIQQLTNPPQPAPDMFENPEGWQGHFGGQIRQTAVQEASFNSLLNTSEMLCRDKFEDFEDAKAKFMELAESNPVLAQQALNDPHPWRKAYQLVKNHEKMEALGATDSVSLEAKLREQIRAELEAELKANPPAADIPQSLASAQSGRGPVVTAAPLSLSQILGQ